MILWCQKSDTVELFVFPLNTAIDPKCKEGTAISIATGIIVIKSEAQIQSVE